LDEGTEPWGVMVERVEVKDVRVPEQLQRAMAAEAEAAREARAKVIAAEGEHKASRALRLAAEVMTDSPAALQVKNLVNRVTISKLSLLQLRYLQTLNSIAAENNSTIVFPVPIDIMSSFMEQSNNNQQQQYQEHMFQQMSQGLQQPLYPKQAYPTLPQRDSKTAINQVY
jgi:erythrocyte band 7 integral membrane protein